MKIAPTLRWMIDTAVYPDTKDNWVKADKELRAVLAVVRAAKELYGAYMGRPSDPYEVMEIIDPHILKVRAALDRLKKASKEGEP